jgi:hypothetical protein
VKSLLFSVLACFMLNVPAFGDEKDQWHKSGNHYNYEQSEFTTFEYNGTAGSLNGYTLNPGGAPDGFSYVADKTTASAGGLNVSVQGDEETGSGGVKKLKLNSAASATAWIAADTSPVAFTISMSGELTNPGEGENPVSWSASAGTKFFWIAASGYDQKEISVPAGTSLTYTAYEGDSGKNSNWTVSRAGESSQTKSNTSNITFSRSFWGNITAWFTSNQSVTTPVPGVYYISASPTDNNNRSDSDVMTVIGIASITGTTGTVSVASTIDNTENLTADQTMYLYKGQGTIDFSAVKDPVNSEWPVGYPKWKNGNTVVGTGETYTFDAPSSAGEHIITAHCGDGYYKAIKVIVFELQATDMAFNYDRTSSSSDGMNLRASYSGAEIVAPEATAAGGDKKALYKKDTSITIKTRFEIEPVGATPALKVMATVSGGSIEGLDEESITINDTGISDGDTIATKEGFVAFSSTKETADKIKKETYDFQWKLTEIGGEELTTPIDLNSFDGVTVYTVLDTPQSPWTPNGTGTAQPWVNALDFAIDNCDTNDEKTKLGAISSVTSYLDSNSNWHYNNVSGYPSTCLDNIAMTGGAMTARFNLTRFMGGGAVNCYDSGCAVNVVSSLLGVDAGSQRQMPFQGWYAHCYATYNGGAFDSCRAGSVPLVINEPLTNYESYGGPVVIVRPTQIR